MEASIITVKKMLTTDNLQIPVYQRPYKWTNKNVNQLIDDIILHTEKTAYSLGTLVIHQHFDTKKGKIILDIVDGQQRILTLTLIAIAIENHLKDDRLIEYKHKIDFSFTNNISKANIQNNYKAIKRRVEEEFDEKTVSFFYNNCKLVQIILFDNVSEAFQFFDSQNTRGKELEPHDLLKAFHLREMNNSSTEEEKKKIVERWEAMDIKKLSKLFAHYLFRIRNWSKGYSARYFTKNDINVFKGINPDIKEYYPFAKIFRIAHDYIGNRLDYPFQLDQTIINGKRFFEMIAYYDKMIEDIKNDDKLNIIKEYKGSYRTGDKYIRNLFYCGLIYYVDKFGNKDLSKAIDKIFIWAYTLRLKSQSVRLDSIDNYALNKHIHSQIQLFKEIREATKSNDILNIRLEILKLEEKLSTKTEDIDEIFRKMEYL